MPPTLTVIEADLANPGHQRDVLAMTQAYAADPLGNGAPLPEETCARLIDALRAHPTTHVFLAYSASQPVGIATCFTGFSTFAARPLLNIHDLSVIAPFRGQGVVQALFAAVEAKARALGCIKLTLEVGSDNPRAQAAYRRAGFTHSGQNSTAGPALFYEKRL